VIMGRKTWESLPEKYHDPASGRKNFVLTSNREYQVPAGVAVIHDLVAFFKECANEEVWVIGGADLFNQFQYWADFIYITDVAYTVISPDGKVKTLAPQLSGDYWQLKTSKSLDHRLPTGRIIDYKFLVYKRK